ncbi:MAG: GrrA/OscA1 family cyclophane-containing rSAM-modified RiPP [Cyanobacteriota bacterium]
MPQSRSAGLLAFLLALPSLALAVPPATEAAATAAAPEVGPSGAPAGSVTGSPPPAGAAPAPGEAMEARLRRLSDAIRERSSHLEEGQAGTLAEPWVAAGAWGNGGGRGWANRGWTNRAFGNNYYGQPPVWANFRPGWGNFRNGPSFLNW